MSGLVRLATTSVALAFAASALFASGCSSPPSTPSPPAPTPSPSPSAGGTDATGPAELDALRVTLVPVTRDLDDPLFVTSAGDGSGRLFVVEQGGTIRVLRDGRRQEGAYLDVSDRIAAGGERGLLGLAFAPDYASSGVFYVNYTDTSGDTVIARFTAGDPASDTPALTGPERILRVPQPYANHNGGCLVFEPGTERLWVGMGDGGAGGDPENRAQNPRELLGKMLVLDFSAGAKPKPQIVQRGVRNPWRFSFDRETHDLWIGDVGQNAWEEIDFVPLAKANGVNWGWNRWEGSHAYPEGARSSRRGFRFPITEYGREAGQSVTGGYVYRGSESPALAGTYLYADFGAGWIAGLQRLDSDGSVLAKPRVRTLVEDAGSPSSFGEDEAGELYVCDHGGTVYRITATAD